MKVVLLDGTEMEGPGSFAHRGTVTGRFTHVGPTAHEAGPEGIASPLRMTKEDEARLKEAWKDLDFSLLELRVLALAITKEVLNHGLSTRFPPCPTCDAHYYSFGGHRS